MAKGKKSSKGGAKPKPANGGAGMGVARTQGNGNRADKLPKY
jgi:hypothetical protein